MFGIEWVFMLSFSSLSLLDRRSWTYPRCLAVPSVLQYTTKHPAVPSSVLGRVGIPEGNLIDSCPQGVSSLG